MIDKTEMYDTVFIGTIFLNGYCKKSTNMGLRDFPEKGTLSLQRLKDVDLHHV